MASLSGRKAMEPPPVRLHLGSCSPLSVALQTPLQVCVSVQRVFAPKSMAREVAARFAEVARIQKIGDPTEPETEVGPLIRHREVDRVHQWVTEAVQVVPLGLPYGTSDLFSTMCLRVAASRLPPTGVDQAALGLVSGHVLGIWMYMPPLRKACIFIQI